MDQHGLDAAHAAGGRFLFLDLEPSEIAGVLRVRTAADLLAELAHRVDLDLLAVLAFEETDRALCLRFLDGHLLAGDRNLRGDRFDSFILCL